MAEIQPGPCAMCGRENYPLSMGGPSLCPSCDCGNIDPGRMKVLLGENLRLRSDYEALQASSAKREAELQADLADAMKIVDDIRTADCYHYRDPVTGEDGLTIRERLTANQLARASTVRIDPPDTGVKNG